MNTPLKQHQKYVDHQESSEDIMSERICQLQALLTSITGEGFDSYKRYNEDIQQNILWLADALIDDIYWHFTYPNDHLKEANNGK